MAARLSPPHFCWQPILRSLCLLACLPAAVFLLLRGIPADPARIILGPNASQQSVIILRKQMGLDLSRGKQLIAAYRRVITLDFGKSPDTGRLILPEALERFGVTLRVGMLSCVFAILAS